MNYITIKEACLLWNISERRIRKLIQDERIEGAKKLEMFGLFQKVLQNR